PFFTRALFYPGGVGLFWHTLAAPAGALSLPFALVGDGLRTAVLAQNALGLFATVATGLGGAALAAEVSGSTGAGAIAGLRGAPGRRAAVARGRRRHPRPRRGRRRWHRHRPRPSGARPATVSDGAVGLGVPDGPRHPTLAAGASVVHGPGALPRHGRARAGRR